MLHSVYLGLGSNQGPRRRHISAAIRLLSERVGPVVRQSSLIETEPWGFQSARKFLNGVVLCHTSKSPREVLLLTQQIERELGRQQKTPAAHSQRLYADRPIDIDILLYDDLTVNEPDLQIPHPLMYERDFVLIPLKEITNQ